MEFSRQEYWSGLPFSFPEDLPDPGIELTSLESPALQEDSIPSAAATAAAAKSLQSCLTLCDPIPGILQARTPERVAISFSKA